MFVSRSVNTTCDLNVWRQSTSLRVRLQPFLPLKHGLDKRKRYISVNSRNHLTVAVLPMVHLLQLRSKTFHRRPLSDLRSHVQLAD